MADEATKKADSEEREKKEEAVASGVLLRSRVKSVPISTYIRPAARWVPFFLWLGPPIHLMSLRS